MQGKARHKHRNHRQNNDLQSEKRGESRRLHLPERLKESILSRHKREHAQHHQTKETPCQRIVCERHHQRNRHRPENPHNQLRKYHKRKCAPVLLNKNPRKNVGSRLQHRGKESAENTNCHSVSLSLFLSVFRFRIPGPGPFSSPLPGPRFIRSIYRRNPETTNTYFLHQACLKSITKHAILRSERQSRRRPWNLEYCGIFWRRRAKAPF